MLHVQHCQKGWPVVTDHLHVHVHLEGLLDLREDLHTINDTLREGFQHMSESSEALTQAVTDVATRFETLNSTLQTELGEITAALGNATDAAALQQAAADAVARLQTVASQLDAMNGAISAIIP